MLQWRREIPSGEYRGDKHGKLDPRNFAKAVSRCRGQIKWRKLRIAKLRMKEPLKPSRLAPL